MSDNEDILYGVIFFLLGVGAFFWGFMRLRRKRMIENIPTSSVRGLAMGLVELIGKAKKENFFLSPLNNTPCVYYRYLVERYERRGRSSSWVTIAKGDSSNCPFYLDDGTGKIMVFPQGAEVILAVDYRFETGILKGPAPSNLVRFMENKGIRYRGWFGNYSMRFREWYICPEQKVYVLGVAKKTQNSLTDNQNKLMKRLQELKQNPVKMSEVDLNKDGQISQEEWDLAVVKVERELLEEELKSAQTQNPLDVVIGKGDVEKLFIISDYSQKELAKKLTWQAFAGIFGGAVLAIAALCYFILSF